MHRLLHILAGTFAILGMALLGGCFGGGAAGSCRPPNEPTKCQDWSSSLPNAKSSYKLACEAGGSVYSDDPCPDAGKVGGCMQNTNNADGSEVIDWRYTPDTREAVMMSCMTKGEPFVEP
jgi:hypothetical protein